METIQAPMQGQGPFIGLPGEVASNESTFDFWGLLNRRKWIVFIGLVTGLGLGYLYHTQAMPVYQSAAKILVEPKNPIALVDAKRAAYPGLESYTQAHDKIMMSSSFATNLLKENDLANLVTFRGKNADECRDEIIDGLEVLPDRQEPNIFYLSFSCNDELDCQKVMVAAISTYENILTSKCQQRTQRRLSTGARFTSAWNQ